MSSRYDIVYGVQMEAAFEEWFEARRRASWARTLSSSELGQPMPEHWSNGLYGHLREGWMAAALWCRLCKREHEGACISTAVPQTPTVTGGA